ncbi:putative receptor protein kinase ZmPK1 [Nicotiana tabacum]|uniref:Receptor-like serine/threonine-protein kinase n=1 Tax=Nicotiana tabacum TaxID=4097 RepID=A0A1S3XGG9_TOBAC|nr:PREDICTED: putative receptor protein kinase ZmPK1 [Nicotiana tabacum]
MDVQILILVLASLVALPVSSSSTIFSLSEGSLSAPQDSLLSPNEEFTAGFYSVGDNAYFFAIWFTKPLANGNNTVVWMANRDQPINGRKSHLSLLKSGNLVLIDANQINVWESGTQSSSSVELRLLDNGNLVLVTSEGQEIWQSFDSPTDTLLPEQPLTKTSKLVSRRSSTNFSSGFYQVHFNEDNVLHLVFDGIEMTSVFWPSPWLIVWDAGRSTYNDSKTAVLDRLGNFVSSDEFRFQSADYGVELRRRLTLDVDGNIRLYSLDMLSNTWRVTWQLFIAACRVHGVCGLNSLCSYDPYFGRKCSCIPGYRMRNPTDWSYGCEPEFAISCNDTSSMDFFPLHHVEFYGYDIAYFRNKTLQECKNLCLKHCDCKGFQYKFVGGNGTYGCYPKTLLFNGYVQSSWPDIVYVKLPKGRQTWEANYKGNLQCDNEKVMLDRAYKRKEQHGWIKSFIWSIVVAGVLEILCFLTYWIKTRKGSHETKQGYLQLSTRFKKFTYAELKKASSNFSEEIGRGGGSIVYKGKLSDDRVAAIKSLSGGANYQGEAEFLAEVSTIGNLNHMNLIELWGYCAEGKHRLMVYEYMEYGSLSDNLHANKLDWEKRFEIALGTAKGLAYLHEECLEWVLHCDVKPQNILLDSNYKPKVADFGLSKILNRGGLDNSSFSTIRGTRGYMAPEWIFKMPITSKVDVYSYGIVLLEMITGKSPEVCAYGSCRDNDAMGQGVLVTWIREKMRAASETKSWIQEIVDPSLNGIFDLEKMEILLKVALQCSEEDRDARPTMCEVVDKMLHPENLELKIDINLS